jgi:hypothetical protein
MPIIKTQQIASQGHANCRSLKTYNIKNCFIDVNQLKIPIKYNAKRNTITMSLFVVIQWVFFLLRARTEVQDSKVRSSPADPQREGSFTVAVLKGHCICYDDGTWIETMLQHSNEISLNSY